MSFLIKSYSMKKILKKKFTHRKKFSIEVKNEAENNIIVCSSIDKLSQNLLIPCLKQDRLKKISEITGLSIKMGYFSWAKISIPSLKIIEWNFQIKPEDFKNMDEASVLNFAHSLKQSIPVSHLYVMEKIGSREGSKNLNDIRLSSMLMVLLNDFSNSMQVCEKVVFQKENLMNVLYNMSVGNERISARQVFETLLYEMNDLEKTDVSRHGSSIFHSLTKTNLENLKFYDNSSLLQQESLSFVLLLTLSFIDVFIYHSAESQRKIQMLTKFRKIKK